MKISVIGAGAWGTALAKLLHQNGHRITLWAHNPARLEAIRLTGRNERYLPGVRLPGDWILETDLLRASATAEAIIIAVPSKFFREVTSQMSGFAGIAVSVTKGIEYDTGLSMSGVLRSVMPGAKACALSGPTLAMEVAREIPGAIVAANESEETVRTVQKLFHCPTLRVYTSHDLPGVELGGALKNVFAIAAGTSDGLGFGDNSKAALITRAIVEMRRLGVAGGADPDTFAGLSGLGDLVVTCFSKLSRNRAFGERLGHAENVEQILANTVTVAEGYPTTRSAYQLARRLGVETPIIDGVHAMLYEGTPVREALQGLMSRDTRSED